jgi:hypothetical protein
VIAAAPPLHPDGPAAQRWLNDELAKPEYRAAQPTWFDRVAHQIGDWFASLGAGGAGSSWVIAAIGLALVTALVVGAIAVFGLPRLARRRTPNAVFDDADARTAAGLRAEAAAAAAAGRFDDAVLDLFRAMTRSLADRTLVLVLPGTTATHLAAEAVGVFPQAAARLRDAARLFDGVRYLDRGASAGDYAFLTALDDDLRRERPALPEHSVSPAATR